MTPLIDVVFLLLVFFMLASQFGRESAVDLVTAGAQSETYSGPPRLVLVREQTVLLNGELVEETALSEALSGLVTAPDDMIVLRPDPEANVQRLTDLIEHLSHAGFTRLVVVE